jgi:hypothetical protein
LPAAAAASAAGAGGAGGGGRQRTPKLKAYRISVE